MELVSNSFRYSLSFLGSPVLLLTLIVVGMFFYRRNLDIEKEQEYLVGEKVNSAIELTFSQLLIGIIAGIIASMCLFTLGITFEDNLVIEIMFMISFLLMFFKSRMICFSYSGAILGIISLVITYMSNKTGNQNPIGVNIVALISFVGVMHFIEAGLIMLDGFRGAIPIFKISNGKVVGGFKLNRCWLIPTVIVMFTNNKDLSNNITLSTMSFKLGIMNLETLMTLVFFSVALYAMIGYKSSTFTISKENKVKESGVIVGFYAIILMLIAQISRIGIGFEILSLVLMPIIHELMLSYQLYREKSREKIYISDDGVAILDILPKSPFKDINVKSGDKVLSINGFKVKEERDILRIKNEYYGIIIIEIKKVDGNVEVHHMDLRENDKLGLVLVPKSVELVNKEKKNFEEILSELKKEIEYKIELDLKNSVNISNLEIKEKEIENKGDKN